MLSLANSTSRKVHYLEDVRNSARRTTQIALVGDKGRRICLPLITAVAASPLLASALCDKCGSTEDVIVILPGISATSLQMFADYILGETIYGSFSDFLILEDLCSQFKIKFQSVRMTEGGTLHNVCTVVQTEQSLSDETDERSMMTLAVSDAFSVNEENDTSMSIHAMHNYDEPALVLCNENQNENNTLEDDPIVPYDEMMDEEFDDASEDTQPRTTKTSKIMLPKHSKAQYEHHYRQFCNWKFRNNMMVNEEAVVTYFQELSKLYSPSTLWTKYSILKSTLIVHENIDISCYKQLLSYLKQNMKGYVPKTSNVLTRDQVLKFLQDAPNETYLMHKVVLIMGVFGAMKRDEMVRMHVDHVQDKGDVLDVYVPEIKTGQTKRFTIMEEEEIHAVKLVRQYRALRPKGIKEQRFFLTYKNNSCVQQPVGKNTIGSVPSVIAQYLQLDNPKQYTGHCMRRTSSTLFVESGAAFEMLKVHSKGKTTDAAKEYITECKATKNRIANMIASYVDISGADTAESSGSACQDNGNTFNT